MIRQQAFGGDARLLKGGLHSHSTRSDGDCAPEEVIRIYKQNGYDFLALTDHNIYNYENFAPETDITIIPGIERNYQISKEGVHVYHTVCIGPKREDGNGFTQDERFISNMPTPTQEDFQRHLDAIHQRNNMTLYCHPEWSGTPAEEIDRLKGCFGMEIWNSGCAIENDLDADTHIWDTLLRKGMKIYGVATDDGHAVTHHCHGWVRVRAENNVSSILNALRDGAFYSSCGPEIYDFYVKDGRAYLDCSPCAYAGFRNGMDPTRLTFTPKGAVTHAELDIPPYFRYIRAVVKDAQGNRAWSNPIFLDMPEGYEC